MSDPLELLKKIDRHPLLISSNHRVGEKSGLNFLLWLIKRPLLKLYYSTYKLFNPNCPWLCITAIEFLKKYLSKDLIGVEFGSGSSTYFFCKRSKFVVSIEHNEVWHKLVKEKLEDKKIENVDYRLLPESTDGLIKKQPDFLEKWKIDLNSYSYRDSYAQYFNGLKEYEDNYFDYILVDGRARPECLFTSVPKLKSGGMMILDNSERDRYSIIFEKLKSWKTYTCTSGLWDTTFWIKP